MQKIDLNGTWQAVCYCENGDVDFKFGATVPGCVHTDLINQKIIDYDIFYRDNADKCQWIENRSFDYEKSFTVEELSSKAELVFEGLDTYTNIYLNGEEIAATDDMFVEHRIDVSKNIKKGENTLKVHFRSPIKEVEGRKSLPAAFTNERLHSRRIQCTYGWDWVARFVTAGIFKDAYIELGEDFAVDNTYIYTVSIEGDAPQICFEAEFKNFEKGEHITVEVISPEGNVVHSHRYYVKEKDLKDHINIVNGRLWYPAGYGEQPIYTLKIHNKEFKFGIRTAVIHQVKDAVGGEYYNKALSIKETPLGKLADKNEEFSGFELRVNGIPVFCKGANWVPSEPFPSAEDNNKMTEILTLAKEANLNMLRVWGGGLFERQHFYNECDRLGIMTTQDFLMACGQYPEYDDYFIEQLKKETEYAAKELRNHPSLMWWSGDNENAVRGSDDTEVYNGRTAIHIGIAPLLMKFDPNRRFMPSSPCGGNQYQSMTVGTTHHTNFLGDTLYPYINKEDMVDYKDFFKMFTSRFVSEEPTLGAISLPSLRRFMTDDDIFNSDDMWLFHTKDLGTPEVPNIHFAGNFARKVLGEFANSQDKVFKLKYAQYEWVRVTMENLRRNKGYCNGEIYWMWNDCWPAAIGWAFVDYFCQPKASYYSFKRAAAPIVTSLTKDDNKYKVYIVGDIANFISGELTLMVANKNGVNKISSELVSVNGSLSNMVKELDDSVLGEGEVLIAEFKMYGKVYRTFYRDGNLPIVPSDAVKITEQTENSITVTASGYVHAVELEGEYVFEDNYFSMLPNESRTITFKNAREHQSDDITLTAYTIKF
jgi:beta-mannosidase